MAEDDKEPVEDYGQKERGYVQPYDDYIDSMISYIDSYATDEPSTASRRKMMKDAQVKGVVELIKESVLSSGWEINYDWDEQNELGTEMVNFLYESLNRINEFSWSAGGIEDLIEKWMDALWYKKMVCELVYAHDKQQEYIYVRKAKVLPPESIQLPCDRYGNLEAIKQFPYSIDTTDLTGTMHEMVDSDAVSLDMNKVLLWVNGDDYSQYEGRSELDAIYKYWFLKDFILKFWSMFVERFGAPLLIAFVKAKNMKTARDSLKNIITQTSFAMEKDDKIDMLEPKKEGEAFKMMITYCDNQITKGLLVPQLLYGEIDNGGSGSLGNIHLSLFEVRVNYIRRKMENLMRALIKKEIDLNFSGVKHYPIFTFKPYSETKRVKMAQAFDLLIKNALVHPLEPWIRTELQLPEVEDRFVSDLDDAWKAKMSAGSMMQIGSADAGITRTGAQTNQRQPKDVGEFAITRTAELKEQLEAADEKFGDFLIPTVQDSIKSFIKDIEKKLKADKSIEFAETPAWLDNLKFNITGLGEGFTGVYDEILIDVMLADNTHLTQLGMKSAFDVQTRTGAFNWIDQRIADVKSGLHDYGSANANDLQVRILEDTKAIVQNGIDEGLRGRDIVTNLEDGLLGNRYSKGQLQAVVRTNTTSIINQGKKGFARANTPFVKGMRFYAVIDKHTTDICRERDGKEFAIDDPELDKNTPSLHFSCRSILDFIIEGSPKYSPEGITTEIPEGFGGDI